MPPLGVHLRHGVWNDFSNPLHAPRDTAGQERYQTITKQYYRRAQVIGARGGETEARGGQSAASSPLPGAFPAGHFPSV